MAFGPIMQLKVGELTVELAPIAKSDLGEFVAPGMQQASISRYLRRRAAPVLEDELDWFEKTRSEVSSLVWGIYIIDGDKRILIGDTALQDITDDHFIQSVSGSMIFKKEYWGRGIASAIHKARTWYVFYHLGHDRIKSAVVHGNVASRKALEKSGYTPVFIERNTVFVNGKFCHQDNLECLNPSEQSWRRWWGGERPPRHSLDARQKTLEAMEWALGNVTLL
jgi:RimJ/RimL family protein N-acetyltransferase